MKSKLLPKWISEDTVAESFQTIIFNLPSGAVEGHQGSQLKKYVPIWDSNKLSSERIIAVLARFFIVCCSVMANGIYENMQIITDGICEKCR
jgi:hypothetical protein